MQRTGRGGGDQRLFEKKSFFRKPKTSTKHCEITHLCIMHGVKGRMKPPLTPLGTDSGRERVCVQSNFP